MISETTPLTHINEDSLEQAPPSESSSLAEEMISLGENVAAKLSDPWPRSFQRSVSLLAGPTSPKQVTFCTTSPRFTHYNISKKYQKLTKESIFMSPALFSPGMSNYNGRSQRVDSSPFSRVLNRVKSLDFDFSPKFGRAEFKKNLNINQNKIKKRENEAAEYRQKILQSVSSADDTQRVEIQKPASVDKKPKEGEGASFAQSTFNISNILMGVGLLGLPYVLAESGIVGGTLILLIFSLITWRTSILIGKEMSYQIPVETLEVASPTSPSYQLPFSPSNKKNTVSRESRSPSTFPEIAIQSFGPNAAIFLSIVLYFELFSCLCIFFVSLGDHLSEVTGMASSKCILITSFALLPPTVLLRTPRLLSYLSAVGTVATVIVVLSVFGGALILGPEESVSEPIESNTTSLIKPGGVPIALGLVAYCFSGHAIIPSIHSSMQNKEEFNQMITTSWIIVVISCLLVGWSGYYAFGDAVADQVTLSLAGTSLPGMTLLAYMIILTNFSKFTLTLFPLALGMEELAAPFVSNIASVEFIATMIRIVIIYLALTVAIFVPSFSILCSLVGLICTMIVSVIFPAGANLKFFWNELNLLEKILDCSLIAFGVVAAVLGTLATV